MATGEIFGKVNVPTRLTHYKGKETPTASVEVDRAENTIAVNVKVEEVTKDCVSEESFSDAIESLDLDIDSLKNNKQDKLYDGGASQNIKTINGESILGTGNIYIQTEDHVEWGSIEGTLSSQTDLKNALDDKQNVIDSNNKLSASLVSGLASVATSGSYNDLNDKPTIEYPVTDVTVNGTSIVSNTVAEITVPTDTSELTNGAGYLVSNDLNGYATQQWVGNQHYLTSVSWSEILSKPTFSAVATSGSYNDLTDKPATVTINDTVGSESISDGTNTVYTCTVDTAQTITALKTFNSGLKTNSIKAVSGSEITFDESLVPEVTDSVDIGSSTKKVRDVYIAGKLKDGTNELSITDIIAIGSDVDDILFLIPAQATAQNQLADKAFVNSSISSQTANFLGTYDIVSDLELTVDATRQQIISALNTKLASLSIVPTNNDYVYIAYPNPIDASEKAKFDRYKYSVANTTWDYEYTLNNSSFTADQWNAIQSGITSAKVQAYDAHLIDKNNPHEVTASQVGLGNVENKSVATIKSEMTGSIASGNTGFVTGGEVYDAFQQGGGSGSNENTFVFNGNMKLGAPLGKYTTASQSNPVTISSAGKSFKTVWNDIFDVSALPITVTTPSISSTFGWSGNNDTFGGKCTPSLTVSILNHDGAYQYEGGSRQSAELTWKKLDGTHYCKLQIFSDSARTTQIGSDIYTGTNNEASSFTFSNLGPFDIDTASKTLYFKVFLEYNDSSVVPVDNLGTEHPEQKITGSTLVNNNASKTIESLGKISFSIPALTVSNSGNIAEYSSAVIPANKRWFNPTITQASISGGQGSWSGYSQPASISYSLVMNEGSPIEDTTTSNTKVYVSEAQTAGATSISNSITCSITYNDLSNVTFTSKNGYTIAKNSTNINGYISSGNTITISSAMTLTGTKTTYSNLYTLPSVSMSSVTFSYGSTSNEYGVSATGSATISYTSGKFKYNSSGTQVNTNAGETFTKPSITYTNSEGTSNISYKGGPTVSASASYSSSNWNTSSVVANCYTDLGHSCPNARTAYISAVNNKSASLSGSGTPTAGTKYIYYGIGDSATTIPSSVIKTNSTTSYEDSFTTGNNQYIWFITPSAMNTIEQYVSGEWITIDMNTVSAGAQSITLSSGKTVSNYYSYRTDKFTAGTNTFRIK